MTLAMNRKVELERTIPWILAAAAAVTVTVLVAGSGAPVVPRSSGGSTGPAVAGVEEVPAYVQEAIVYGEMAPGTAASAAILPTYIVEGVTYGDIEGP